MLPDNYPTHQHAPQFWEQLGRTIATFGVLEEGLGKAVYAFTATRPLTEREKNDLNQSYDEWLKVLDFALRSQLVPLAEKYGKVVKQNPKSRTENVDDLVSDIKKAAEIRNVLCHGSWREPATTGHSVPFFINRKGDKFETPIDIDYLKQVQKHVTELICSVVNSVRSMGYKFPGTKTGQGEEI